MLLLTGFILVSSILFVPFLAAEGAQNVKVIINQDAAKDPSCETKNNCFSPSSISIKVGDTVTWLNSAGSPTTVTSGTPQNGPDGKFDSGFLQNSKTYSKTFDKTGNFAYFSMVHPWMKGMVKVSNESMDKTGHSMKKVLTPLAQIKSGVLPSEVQCRDDFHLILNSVSNKPVCVSSQGAEKLIMWGWGIKA